MRRIVVVSTKGGVGKTSVAAGLALALAELGHKVGALDLDFTGPNLHLALGVDSAGDPSAGGGLKFEGDSILPLKVKGLELFTMASFWSRGAAVLWREADHVIESKGTHLTLPGSGMGSLVRQIFASVAFSADLEYLVIDTPPTTSTPLLNLFEAVGADAALIVCQPTALSVEDVERTLDLLKEKRIPVLGIVSNMDGVVCPGCHHLFYPFLDRQDLSDLIARAGVPLLARLPLSSDPQALISGFRSLAHIVADWQLHQPWVKDLRERLERAAMGALVKGAIQSG